MLSLIIEIVLLFLALLFAVVAGSDLEPYQDAVKAGDPKLLHKIQRRGGLAISLCLVLAFLVVLV